MTLYNSGRYFMRALDSVLAQTLKDQEIIIVDDGSDDGIENLLFPVLKSNNNIKYLRHSNRKHPLSLNAGLRISSGEFISFLDSDDEYISDYLEERVNYFTAHPETDLICSPAELIGEEEDFYVPDANDQTRLIHVNDCIIGGTFFGKRKVFEELSGFNNVYSHDSDFYRRAEKVYNVKMLDSKKYIYYRNNTDSVLSKLKKNTGDYR